MCLVDVYMHVQIFKSQYYYYYYCYYYFKMNYYHLIIIISSHSDFQASVESLTCNCNQLSLC